MHKPESIQENEVHKIPSDLEIQIDYLILIRIWDLVLIFSKKRKKRTCHQMDFAIPAEHWEKRKETKNVDNYSNLAREFFKKKPVEQADNGDTNCN